MMCVNCKGLHVLVLAVTCMSTITVAVNSNFYFESRPYNEQGHNNYNGIRETITKLFDTIKKSQILSDTEFRLFPLSWEQQKGMYPNDVKLNFHGDLQYWLVRDKFAVPDNNMFTPAWVTASLLEALLYSAGSVPQLSKEQVDQALMALDKYRNLNKPFNNSEMTFWPQKLNETAKYYQSSPDNLFEILKMPDYLPQKVIEEILSVMGLKELEKLLEELFRSRNMFFQAFHIPPDFDDTFVNLGLGGVLSMVAERGDLTEGFLRWKQQNNNLTSVFESVKKYAYRPFSTHSHENTIDPRTYMYLHTYLEEAQQNNQDVALITTWLQNTEEVITLFDKGDVMPFNVNNVDITVSANFMYGVIMCVCTKVCDEPEMMIDQDVQQIFMNTTSLIVHELRTNLSSRPDLALTYYPSKFEFYWFVSRSYAYLNRFYIQQNHRAIPAALDQMLKFAYTELGNVLHNQMSDDVQRSVHTDSDGTMYVDDFLGNNDVNLFNRTENRAEDRIFTTAVSVNALINTWTIQENGKLVWENGTPDSVKSTVNKLVNWLNKNVLSGRYKPWNAFFSGSGKGLKSMPFFYPANRMEYFNGTKISGDSFPTSDKNIIGMQGVVTSDEYAAMLNQRHFGMPTPMTFDGYNSEVGGFFPFWSCDTYTYAVSLLALAQGGHLSN